MLILVNHRRLYSHEETGGDRSRCNHGFHFFGAGGAQRGLSFRVAADTPPETNCSSPGPSNLRPPRPNRVKSQGKQAAFRTWGLIHRPKRLAISSEPVRYRRERSFRTASSPGRGPGLRWIGRMVRRKLDELGLSRVPVRQATAARESSTFRRARVGARPGLIRIRVWERKIREKLLFSKKVFPAISLRKSKAAHSIFLKFSPNGRSRRPGGSRDPVSSGFRLLPENTQVGICLGPPVPSSR